MRCFAPVLLVAAVAGQHAPPLDFEVAAVRVSPPVTVPMDKETARGQERAQNLNPPGSLPLRGTNLSLHYRSLQQLIASAYSVRIRDVIGPAWISQHRFHVDAKMPAGAREESANEMLRTLLEQRFALRAHRETRVVEGYALAVAANGPRLKPGVGGSPAAKEMPPRPDSWSLAAVWRSRAATSADIAAAVSNMLDAPVADETSLAGAYDISMEVPRPDSPDEPVIAHVGHTLSRLGLRLERRKVPVRVVVVDSASQTPTEN